MIFSFISILEQYSSYFLLWGYLENIFLISISHRTPIRDMQMRHLPVYLDTLDTLIVVSGAGDTAIAKVRLLLKTQARIHVFGVEPAAVLRAWSAEGKIELSERSLLPEDVVDSRLVYAANDDEVEDARVARIGREAGAIVNVVDNLDASDFITPAIVDRSPLTVAIGSEGAAPVLARQIKVRLEQQLDSQLGLLARVGKQFRGAASALPKGRATRGFWAEYYETVGPAALAEGGEQQVQIAISNLLAKHLAHASDASAKTHRGYVWIIGAGPGDPDHLTNKARRAMHDADVIVHDRLVSNDVLELARREAVFVEVGKTPGGQSWQQSDINQLMVDHASKGLRVARLKSGDPAVYGRLDEEMDALDAAEISFEIVPGITTALAAAAKLKVSLTKRQRNSEFRLLTGHDVNGFAEHEWRALGRPGAVAAIYMGLRATRFLQGRLLMHGADPATPISIIENVSRENEAVLATTLQDLDADVSRSELNGPALILFGLAPRNLADSTINQLSQPAEPRIASGASL